MLSADHPAAASTHILSRVRALRNIARPVDDACLRRAVPPSLFQEAKPHTLSRRIRGPSFSYKNVGRRATRRAIISVIDARIQARSEDI